MAPQPSIPPPSNEPVPPSNEPKPPLADPVAADGATTSVEVKPTVGLLIHALGDGVMAVHAVEPDGTEHQMTIPENHGAFLAFVEEVTGWFTRLGQRSTSWDKSHPNDAAPAKEAASGH